MIHIIRQRAEPEQMRQMMKALGIYIKLAVDIELAMRDDICQLVQSLLGDVQWQ